MLGTPASRPAEGTDASLPGAKIELDCRLDELKRLEIFLSGFASKNSLPRKLAHDLDLALTEWVTNVISYGGMTPGGSSPTTIAVRLNGTGVRAEVADSGRPFDPTRFPAVDTRVPLDERPVGGLGIHLIRTMMDRCRRIN